ncbi:hypothetical protein FOZ60_008385 [Perkinsus olseni]|uniref:Major facilitator super domain-containing protein 1 n=1 Tax=Perkinsus olseni TaxID=32597 RepID=A0A7J6NJH3_PEROL|nr:hypothetical protein FOZ60_008385 [Perkinsus olseni]
MTSSVGPCLEEDDDGGDELDEFCSLKSGSSGSEFLTPRVEPAEPPSSETSSTLPLLSQLPPPHTVDGNPNRRSFWTSCLKSGVPQDMRHKSFAQSPSSFGPSELKEDNDWVEEFSNPAGYVVDPRRIFHRCLLHLLICLYIPGAYFADSVLAAYKTQILEYLRIDHERFALLFSLPSLTGVLCGPFGVMVAKYGSTKSALSAATLTCVGSALVVVGLQNRAYSVVLLGRVVFWTFLYILCVVQTVLCYRLFSGSALVAAYGLIIVACRTGGLVGSAFNAVLLNWYQGDVVKATKTTSDPESTDLWLTPTLEYPTEFDLASVTCVHVVAMSIVTAYYHSREVAPDINAVLQISFSSAMAAVGLVCAIAFAVLYKGTRTARLVWPLLSRRDVATFELSTSNATQRYSLKTLPALYWVLWLALGLLYAAIFPFETIAVDYYVGDWGMTQQRAGKTTTLLLAFTFITIGLVGQGMRLTASPLGFMILTGWGYALGGTCAWVLASDILSAANCRSPPVEAAAVAMLYVSLGVMLFISSYVAGVIRDHSRDYRPCLLFFTSLSSTAWACAAVLHHSAIKGSLSVVRSADDDYYDEGTEADDDLSEETDETPSRLPLHNQMPSRAFSIVTSAAAILSSLHRGNAIRTAAAGTLADDFPPYQDWSFFNTAKNFTYCIYSNRKSKSGDYASLYFTVNETNARLQRLSCPIKGELPAFRIAYIDDAVVSLELYAQPGVFSIADPDSLGHLNGIVSPVLLTDASVLFEEQRKLYSAAGRAATSSKIAVRAKQLQGADKSAIKGVCSGVIKGLKEVDRTGPTFNFSQLCDKFDFLAEQAQDLDTRKS